MVNSNHRQNMHFYLRFGKKRRKVGKIHQNEYTAAYFFQKSVRSRQFHLYNRCRVDFLHNSNRIMLMMILLSELFGRLALIRVDQ